MFSTSNGNWYRVPAMVAMAGFLVLLLATPSVGSWMFLATSAYYTVVGIIAVVVAVSMATLYWYKLPPSVLSGRLLGKLITLGFLVFAFWWVPLVPLNFPAIIVWVLGVPKSKG